ncbi:MAG: signal peptidase II [Anaerolineae bacterium]|nr:signal peptidase II [Thermoflexus sp.]MDW8064195.1 signal peptidase II [Anaerolineae bacterium]
MKRRWIMSMVALFTFAADQLSKAWVRANLTLHESWAPIPAVAEYFTFTHVTNTGIAFGLFREWGSILVPVVVGVIVLLLFYTYRLSAARWPIQLAIGLQLGGAFGNLVDRLRFGFVTDFLDFKFWPVFNLADSAIVIGMLLLLILLSLEKRASSHPFVSSQAQDRQQDVRRQSQDAWAEDKDSNSDSQS